MKTVLKLSALSAALLAAGCGGGGGGDSAPVSSSNDMTVQGVAAKGLIKKGVVEVYALNTQGQKGAKIGTATTADDGSYTIKVPKDTLNFVVEVGAGPDTKMADEATGQDIPMPTTMKLRNAVALTQAPDAAYTSNLSPLTEMAVKAAETAGGLSKDNIGKAKAGVTVALGFDPEKVKPVNSNSDAAKTASEEEKLQSLALAAISKLAKDGGLGCTASDVACVVNKVASAATISGDNLKLDATVQSNVRTAIETVATDTTINKTEKTSVDGTASFASAEVPASTGAATGLQAAKALIASVRNTGTALHNDEHKGVLDISPDKLGQDFDNSIGPLDPELMNWMHVIPKGIDYFARYKAGTTTVTSIGIFESSGGYQYRIGGCTIYSDTTATTVATSPSNAVSVGCSTGERYVYNSWAPTSTGYKEQYVDKGITLIPDASLSNTYSYKARTRLRERTYSTTYVQLNDQVVGTIGAYGSSPSDRATGTIAYTKSGSILTGFTVKGMMPARVDEYGHALTDYEVWNANFARTDEGSNVFKYAISGDFTSVVTVTAPTRTPGKMTVGDGSFARVQEDGSGNVVNNGVKEASLILSGEAGTSKITGTLSLTKFATDKNGYEFHPTKVSFTGTLASNSAEFFSGTLTREEPNFATYDTTKPESSTNFNQEVVSVSGKITIPNRPALTLSVSATRKAIDTVDVIGQYNDGTTVINASVTNGTAGKTLTVSTPNGTSVTVVQGQEKADLTKDSVKVAVIDTSTGVINYVDGSFESLK